MINELEQILREQNIFTYKRSGISVVVVEDQQKGFDLASDILSMIIDKRSVLYLSGGSTPRELYAKLAASNAASPANGVFIPGAAGLVDERYGSRFHANSNEKMIHDTGFLRYLEMLDIPFYPILQSGLSREETAREYDAKLRSLQSIFPKHIGILGIGADGHTAGIPAGSQKSKVKSQREGDFVEAIDNFPGQFRERITMTFMGLAMLDILLVLVFGEEKRKAIDLVFGEGSEGDVPGRFYKRPEIARKTLFITDQRI